MKVVDYLQLGLTLALLVRAGDVVPVAIVENRCFWFIVQTPNY